MRKVVQAMQNKQITQGLEIVKLKGIKFGNSLAYVVPTGFALRHKELGFLSFIVDNVNAKYGVKVPYIPTGGKKALASILEAGGLTDYEGVEWIQPIAE